jgi:hypothetical protein
MAAPSAGDVHRAIVVMYGGEVRQRLFFSA